MTHERAPWVVARASSPGAPALRELLARNKVAFRWLDPDTDPLVGLLGAESALDRPLPLVVLPDGSLIEPPPQYQAGREVHDPDGVARYVATARWRRRVAAAFGLPTVAERDEYDVMIIGAGPAGLTAAVTAASEGLSTLVLERVAPGGQAGTSARIENYPGFAKGVTGAELAMSTYEQALRFGAEILIGVELEQVGRRPGSAPAFAELTNGAVVHAKTALVAPGVAYRKLEAPGVEELIGAGVHYGSAPSKALFYHGADVAIVGGANSAGQAALHLADHARSVTLVCRAAALDAGMSRYLIDRIAAMQNIHVVLSSEVVGAEGESRLEALRIRGSGGETRLPVTGLFVLIGGVPLTHGVSGWLRRDEKGYLMTGRNLLAEDARSSWSLERDPYPLETSQPGVFVAGDVRHGSSKRVASAVGEGAMAVQLIQQYLAEPTRHVLA